MSTDELPEQTCEVCRRPMTEAEGANVFTVCEECWHTPNLPPVLAQRAAPAPVLPEQSLTDLLDNLQRAAERHGRYGPGTGAYHELCEARAAINRFVDVRAQRAAPAPEPAMLALGQAFAAGWEANGEGGSDDEVEDAFNVWYERRHGGAGAGSGRSH